MPTRSDGSVLTNWFQVAMHSLLPQTIMNRQMIAMTTCTRMKMKPCHDIGSLSVSDVTAMCAPAR
ncbi:hypothetical protein D9M70_599250 [compost metagenome]